MSTLVNIVHHWLFKAALILAGLIYLQIVWNRIATLCEDQQEHERKSIDD